MTGAEIAGLILALVLMLVGVVGSVLPGLPGTPLVLAAAVAHKLYFRQESAAIWVILLLALITVVSLIVEYLAGMYGARKMGATWKGVAGAALGLIVGLFFGLPGMILGPFLGAMLFELIGGYEWKKALRAGLGATVGLAAGTLGKLAACLVMILLFTANVIWRSVGG